MVDRDKHTSNRQPPPLLRQPHTQSRRTSSTGAATNTPPQHYCYACQQPCARSEWKHIHALSRLYHYQCFVCEDCQQPVTKKYYAIERNKRQAVVCEKHYYAHMLCARCGEMLFQADEATVQEIDGRRYHEQCVQCPGCLLAKRGSRLSTHSSNSSTNSSFGGGFNNWRVVNRLSRSSRTNNSTSSNDMTTLDEPLVDRRPQYKYDNKSYCRYHYSLLRGTGCTGCGQAILTKPVDDKAEPGKRWHHECFMIYKYWQIKLADPLIDHHGHYMTMNPVELIDIQTVMENKRTQLWKELRDFEDSLATSIYDLAFHITAGSSQESVHMATQLACHLCILFSAHQSIHAIYHDNQILDTHEGPQCDKWSRLIGSQIVQLFRLFDDTPPDQKEKPVVDLVRSLALHLKAFLRVGIEESLRLEMTYGFKNAISVFLGAFVESRGKTTSAQGRYLFKDYPFPKTTRPATEMDIKCNYCLLTVVNACFSHGNGRWHDTCLVCNGCKSRIPKTPLARIGYATPSNKDQSAIIMLCERCTVDPRNRQDFMMQNMPLVYVSQLEQCIHLLRVEVALVHQKQHQKQQQDVLSPNAGKGGGGLFSKKAPGLQMDTKMLAMSHVQPSSPLSPTRKLMVDTAHHQKNTGDQKQGVFGSLYLPGIRRTRSIQVDSNMPAKTVTSMPPRRAVTVHAEESPMAASSPTLSTGASASPTSNNNKLSHSLRRVLSQNKRQQQDQQLRQHQDEQQQHVNSATNNRMAEVSSVQDFLVRNLGAIYVQRYVHQYFELDELASCLDTKKGTMWSKVKLHLWGSTPPPQSPPSVECGKVFGAPLATAAKQRYRHPADQDMHASSLEFLVKHHPGFIAYYKECSMIPVIVQDMILSLLQHDLAVEGIFRKNGNIRELKETSLKVDKGEPYMDALVHAPSSIQLAALLKRYLRDLPEPLLTFKLYKLFITSLRMSNEEEAKSVLHLGCCMLPKPNRDVLQLIFLFLNYVATFKDKNLMDSHNLAVILAPSVFYAPPTSASNNGQLQPRTSREEIEVVDMLIRYQPEFTVIPTDIVSLIQDANMTKMFYNADLTSSKEFLRIYDNLINPKKLHHQADQGILPLTTRSEVTLSTVPLPPQARKK